MSCKDLLFIKLATEETVRSNGRRQGLLASFDQARLRTHVRSKGPSKSHQARPRRTVITSTVKAEDWLCPAP
jgi:hypothetical protein